MTELLIDLPTGFYTDTEIKVSAVPGSAPAGNRCDTNFHFLFIEN